jgi:hypothetical protein
MPKPAGPCGPVLPAGQKACWPPYQPLSGGENAFLLGF